MSLSDVNRHDGRNELRLSITVRELMKHVHEHILMIHEAKEGKCDASVKVNIDTGNGLCSISILKFYDDRYQHFIKDQAEWTWARLAKTVYETRFVRHIFVRSKHFARFTLFTRERERKRIQMCGTKIQNRHVIL